MHPLLEKLMMVGFMISGLCTGTYLFRRNPNETLEKLLEREVGSVLNVNAKNKGDEGYGGWKKKVKALNSKKPEGLMEFMGEDKDKEDYQVTVEKLQEKCEILLVKPAIAGSQDYKNASLFCTGYLEENEGEGHYYM